jgi:RNA polymerase sigma-70 factor (family 1)
LKIRSLYDDADLLRNAAQGNHHAFKLIYEKYNAKLYTFSLRILLSEELAEEVVQEAMLKLWQMGHKLKSINNIEAFLKTVARNKAIDMLRHQQLVVKADNELKQTWNELHNETEEHIFLNDTIQVLSKGLALLPEQHRYVYTLCHQEGLKYEEAAERLQLSPFTVQTYMKLSLRFLRNYISTHTDVAILLIILKIL